MANDATKEQSVTTVYKQKYVEKQLLKSLL